MNSFIETFNRWGAEFLGFAWPMLWQSSVLIAILFAFELLFRRELRASIRYALWLVVLLKLCVPPTLALPTSPAWWLHSTPPLTTKTPLPHYSVTYDNGPLPETASDPLPALAPPPLAMSPAAWLLAVSLLVSSALLLWLLVRWWQIAQRVRRAGESERLTCLAAMVQLSIGLRSKVRVKVTADPMSPAVCGLFCPTILIPCALAEKFSDEQLRAVLLHELIHLRRFDAWLNFVQALLQIFYWWHPLVWLANARIRRVREEAVDDAVMLALREEAEAYAPTLLEVARFALNRPRVIPGLVGILESRQSLRRRIERLVDFHPPRHAGLTLVSLIGILAFTAIAVPMGQGPASVGASVASGELQTLTVKVNPDIFIKNIQAQADRTLRTASDSPMDILTDILRGEGVDCTPPHDLTFDTKAGEITMQNTPVSLGLFRRVIEQLNRADGKCALPLKDLPVRLKMVLISAEFYSMPDADLRKMIRKSDPVVFNAGNSMIGVIDTDHLAEFRERIKSLGLKPFQKPRIQTGNGRPAEFFVGSVVSGRKVNGFEFDCCPLVGDGRIDLAFHVVRDGGLADAETTLVSGRMTAEDHGGIIGYASGLDGSVKTNFVFVIGMQILTNGPSTATNQKLKAVGNSANAGSSDTAAKYDLARADGLVSSAKAPADAQMLLTRTFKIDTQTFVSRLQQIRGMGAVTNQPEALAAAIRKFFSSQGINLESPSGKAVFFNDRNGMLLVKATAADLDIVDKAVETLNNIALQVHVKARFLEVGKGASKFLQQFPKFTNGVAIITAESTRELLKKINSESTETLAEPEIVITSGRQAQARETQVLTLVSGISFEMQYDDLDITTNKNGLTFETHAVETGPILDSVSTVLADGYTIDLKTTASLTEFFGYTPPKSSTPASVQNADYVSLPRMHPSLRRQESSAHANLWDGQTLVLTQFKTKSTGEENFPKKDGKQLLVLITVTMIDPAGNRLHSDEDMRFAQNAVPPQPIN